MDNAWNVILWGLCTYPARISSIFSYQKVYFGFDIFQQSQFYAATYSDYSHTFYLIIILVYLKRDGDMAQ